MPWPKVAANTDKNAPTPVAVKPVPERVAGPVFPYRGQNDHGVAPTQDPWQLGPDTLDYDIGEYREAVDPPVPIPVRIVTSDSREVKTFATSQMVVDGQTRIIAGENERRHQVKIRNMSPDKTVFIGNDMTLSTMTGYPVLPGTVETVDAETAIYAISADATQVIVAVLQVKTIADD